MSIFDTLKTFMTSDAAKSAGSTLGNVARKTAGFGWNLVRDVYGQNRGYPGHTMMYGRQVMEEQRVKAEIRREEELHRRYFYQPIREQERLIKTQNLVVPNIDTDVKKIIFTPRKDSFEKITIRFENVVTGSPEKNQQNIARNFSEMARKFTDLTKSLSTFESDYQKKMQDISTLHQKQINDLTKQLDTQTDNIQRRLEKNSNTLNLYDRQLDDLRKEIGMFKTRSSTTPFGSERSEGPFEKERLPQAASRSGGGGTIPSLLGLGGLSGLMPLLSGAALGAGTGGMAGAVLGGAGMFASSMFLRSIGMGGILRSLGVVGLMGAGGKYLQDQYEDRYGKISPQYGRAGFVKDGKWYSAETPHGVPIPQKDLQKYQETNKPITSFTDNIYRQTQKFLGLDTDEQERKRVMGSSTTPGFQPYGGRGQILGSTPGAMGIPTPSVLSGTIRSTFGVGGRGSSLGTGDRRAWVGGGGRGGGGRGRAPEPSIDASSLGKVFGKESGLPAERLARFADELKDPKVRQAFMGRIQSETGDQNEATRLAFTEEVFNRAMSRGQTLMQALGDASSGYYYGASRLRSQNIPEYDTLINKVLEGSDMTGGATGNASLDVGMGKDPETGKKIWGKSYGGYERFDMEAVDITKYGWREKYAKLRGAPVLGPNTTMTDLKSAETYLNRQLSTAPAEHHETIKKQLEQIESFKTQLQAKSQQTPQVSPPSDAIVKPQTQGSVKRSSQIIGKITQTKGIATRDQMIKALDNALKMEGMNEHKDRQAIQQYLAAGGKVHGMDPATSKWCAAFIGSSLEQAGVAGTNSNWAADFKQWGQPTTWEKMEKGDIVARYGHVGMYTGEKRENKQGETEYQYIGGNQTSDTKAPLVRGNSEYISKKWMTASEFENWGFVPRAPIPPPEQEQKGPLEKLKGMIPDLPTPEQTKETIRGAVGVEGRKSSLGTGDRRKWVTEEAKQKSVPQVEQQNLKQPINQMGEFLQKMGISVSEHPQFGGVAPVHSGPSHYENRSVDVNIGKGMKEANSKEWGPIFDKINGWVRKKGYKTYWRTGGHYNHMHIEELRKAAKTGAFTEADFNEIGFTKAEIDKIQKLPGYQGFSTADSGATPAAQPASQVAAPAEPGRPNISMPSPAERLNFMPSFKYERVQSLNDPLGLMAKQAPQIFPRAEGASQEYNEMQAKQQAIVDKGHSILGNITSGKALAQIDQYNKTQDRSEAFLKKRQEIIDLKKAETGIPEDKTAFGMASKWLGQKLGVVEKEKHSLMPGREASKKAHDALMREEHKKAQLAGAPIMPAPTPEDLAKRGQSGGGGTKEETKAKEVENKLSSEDSTNRGGGGTGDDGNIENPSSDQGNSDPPGPGDSGTGPYMDCFI